MIGFVVSQDAICPDAAGSDDVLALHASPAPPMCADNGWYVQSFREERMRYLCEENGE